MALIANEVTDIIDIPLEDLRKRLTMMKLDAVKLVSEGKFLSVIDYRVHNSMDLENDSLGGFRENVIDTADNFGAIYDETKVQAYGITDQLKNQFKGTIRLIVSFSKGEK
jgi:hypothetical protein